MTVRDQLMSRRFRLICLSLFVAALGCLSWQSETNAQTTSPAADVPAKKDVAYLSFFSGPAKRLIEPRFFTDRNYLSKQRILVQGICSGRKSYEDNKEAFADYFNKYYYPLITHPGQWSPVANTNFAWFQPTHELRQDLKKRYFGPLKSDPKGQEIRDALNQLTLLFMARLVNPKYNFHPSVKYNAMLLVGELDTRGAQTFGSARPAEPWNKGLQFMLDELSNPAQIDAVKVACLIGIRRHAELNKFQPASRRLIEAAVRILIDRVGRIASATTIPRDRSPEGHEWMRRLAIETLGELGTAGPGGSVSKILNDVIVDARAPRQLRAAAAAALGKIANPVAPGSDPAKTAKAMGRVGSESMLAELERVEPRFKELQAEAERAFAGGDRREFIGGPRPDILGLDDGGDGDVIELPLDPHVERLQRQLELDFRQLKMGLKGADGNGGLAAAATAAPQKQLIEEIAVIVDEILDTLEEAPPESPELFRDLEFFRGKLAASGAKLDRLVAERGEDAGPDAGPSPDAPAPDGPSAGPAPDGPTADGPIAPAGPTPDATAPTAEAGPTLDPLPIP